MLYVTIGQHLLWRKFEVENRGYWKRLTYDSHRLSTVMNADIIFVVANGQVVEQGSHEELVIKNGKYAELWSKQIFVKPKERKEGVDDIEPSFHTPTKPENEPTDEEMSEASASEALGSLSTVEEAGSEAGESDVAGGEGEDTPVTHKKEVDPSNDQS